MSNRKNQNQVCFPLLGCAGALWGLRGTGAFPGPRSRALSCRGTSDGEREQVRS